MLLTEHHLDFLSLQGGCTGFSESTLVKMPHCWKSHVAAQIYYIIRKTTRSSLWSAVTMRFPTTNKGSDQPAQLHRLIRAFESRLYISLTVKLLIEHHFEFLSLKGGCTCSSHSESTLSVKMPHCWKSHVAAHITFDILPHVRLSEYRIDLYANRLTQ